MSGDISGAGGSLVKTGTGTRTLTGAKTYAGGIDVTGGTLAIQAPTTLSVAQAVSFGDNTTLAIAAGATSPALSANSITIGNGATFNISGTVDYLTVSTRKSVDGRQYLASYGLAWNAGNNSAWSIDAVTIAPYRSGTAQGIVMSLF